MIEYSSCQLVWHISKAIPSENSHDCVQRLAKFIDSPLGWRWLERLNNIYNVSIGHQQVL